MIEPIVQVVDSCLIGGASQVGTEIIYANFYPFQDIPESIEHIELISSIRDDTGKESKQVIHLDPAGALSLAKIIREKLADFEPED